MLTLGRHRKRTTRRPDGTTVTTEGPENIVRRTRGLLPAAYGCHRDRPLCLAIRPGDLIELWPQGTRYKVSVAVLALYAWLVRRAAAAACLEKARARKEALAAARARRRQAYAERKLTRPL